MHMLTARPQQNRISCYQKQPKSIQICHSRIFNSLTHTINVVPHKSTQCEAPLETSKCEASVVGRRIFGRVFSGFVMAFHAFLHRKDSERTNKHLTSKGGRSTKKRPLQKCFCGIDCPPSINAAVF
jgi:hypothetical protein